MIALAYAAIQSTNNARASGAEAAVVFYESGYAHLQDSKSKYAEIAFPAGLAMQRDARALFLLRRAMPFVNGFVGGTPRVVNQSDICAPSVGRFQEGVFLMGTGSVVVHQKLVLTNAHLVAKEGEVKDRVPFELPNGKGGFRKVMGRVVQVGTKNPEQPINYKHDWAFIALDKDSGVTPLSLSFPRLDQLGRYETSLSMISYSRMPRTVPGSGDKHAIVSTNCGIKGVDGGLAVHNCSGSYGGSGSPMFATEEGWCTMKALFRGGTKLDKDKYPNTEAVPYLFETANDAVIPLFFKQAFLDILARINSGLPTAQAGKSGATRP